MGSMATTGIHLFLDLLAEYGVRYVFGNPGTTEMPLNDALVNDRRFQYILGLQEVPVMAMADGYAMASRQLGVVNLHISCGLGNAMGMLYNAFREGTPLLVTAGQQDRRLMFEEPILWGQMVEVTRPWTKWACEVQRVEDLPSAVRRAVQDALTPPTGPVFLSLPVDLQMELVGQASRPVEQASRLLESPLAQQDWAGQRPAPRLDTRTRPPEDAIRRAAELLHSAENPAILAGSRVTERDAMAELVAVAESLGAPVITESGTTHGRLAFPSDHPLNGQGLPLWSPEVRQRLNDYDVLLVVGMDLLRQYIYFEPSEPIPEHIRLVQIDEDPWQIGKNYPAHVGVLGDTKTSLAELHTLLQEQPLSPARLAQIRDRTSRHIASHQAAREALERQIDEQRHLRPLTPLALMGALARVLPPDVVVVEEAVTTTNTTFERLGVLKNTTGYFGHRGWALGWGLGVALGAKLAWPERPVLALLGEGAAAYGIQGLWSAARCKLPVVFVICNNAQYQILKLCGKSLNLPEACREQFEGVDLVGPEIDYLCLARGFGVEAHRITEPDELAQRVSTALRGDKPVLFDVPIARELQPRLNYG
jgi:benzoylformate decarboxylase